MPDYIPAFPTANSQTYGMGLRDYFAACAPRMDPTAICDIFGWEKDTPLGEPEVEEGGGDWKDTVFQRWHELPLLTRLQAEAKFAFAFADAMLAARDK